MAPEDKYSVKCKPEDAALVVIGAKEPHITVTITLTSPVMREPLVAPTPPAEAAGGKDAGCGNLNRMLWTSHWFFPIFIILPLHLILVDWFRCHQTLSVQFRNI